MGNKITILWSEHCHYATSIDTETLRELLSEDGGHDPHTDLHVITGALSGAEVDDGHLDEFLSGQTVSDFFYAEDRRIDDITIAEGS